MNDDLERSEGFEEDHNGRRDYVLKRKSRDPERQKPRNSKTGEAVHVRSYEAPSWFSETGVHRKRRLLEAKGLPCFRKWRFITLTLNREGFQNEAEGFLAGRARMRRFMEACRNSGLWSKDTKWMWKMEFHEDGWPHWHLLVGRTAKFSEEQLAQLSRNWRLGRVNCEMVREDDFLYSFKYAFKPVFSNDADYDSSTPCVPQWFADFVHQGEGKPLTSGRIRFYQTSRGFYEKPPAPAAEKKPAETSRVPWTVAELAEQSDRKVQVVARESDGRYLGSRVVAIAICAAALWTLSGWHAINQGAYFLGVNSAVLPVPLLKQHITTKDEKLWQILNQNRMTLRAAERLQREPRNWRTC